MRKTSVILIVILMIFLLIQNSVATTPNASTIKWSKVTQFEKSDLVKIIYAKNTFVAAGFDGMLKTSKDGITWTTHDTGTREAIFGAVWGSNKLVAVGSGGVVLSTSDYNKWESKYLGNKYVNGDIAWNGREYIAFFCTLSYQSDIFISKDGISWVKAHSTPSMLNRIIWNGKIFVASGRDSKGGTVAISKDGKKWSQKPVGKNGEYIISSIAWNGNTFVGLATSKNKSGEDIILISKDGVSWRRSKTDVSDSNKLVCLEGVVWGNGKFIAVGSNRKLVSSVDGNTWTIGKHSVTDSFYSLAYGGGKFAAVGYMGAIASSTDGMKWIKRDYSGPSVMFSTIATNGKIFVCSGLANRSTGFVMVSGDGLKWSECKVDGMRSNDCFISILWDDKRFLGLGLTGKIYTSSDGKKWTANKSDLDLIISTMIYADKKYYALDITGYMYVSSDTIRWEKIPIASGKINGFAYGNGKFVAVGKPDVFMESPILVSKDGIHWNEVQLNEDKELQCVVYGAGKFVALGSNAYTSQDGISWKKTGDIPKLEVSAMYDFQDMPLVNSVIWDGKQFVAVGCAGNIFTSSDGESWKLSQQRLTYATLNQIIYNGKVYIAMSQDGTILRGTEK